MIRILEIVLATGVFAILLSSVLAVLAGAVMLLTGLAFIPLFAPLTTTFVVGFFAWTAVRDVRRKRSQIR